MNPIKWIINWLFFGAFLKLSWDGGSSSSSSSQTTNNTDNRRTIGAGGVSAESTISNSTVNMTTLDASVVNQALSFGVQAMNAAANSQQLAMTGLHDTSTVLSNAYADAKGGGANTNWILFAAIAVCAVVALKH